MMWDLAYLCWEARLVCGIQEAAREREIEPFQFAIDGPATMTVR